MPLRLQTGGSTYRPRRPNERANIGGYVTRGQYDVVLVLEMPDGDAMTKLSVGLTTGPSRPIRLLSALREGWEPAPAEFIAHRSYYPWMVVGTTCIAAFIGQLD